MHLPHIVRWEREDQHGEVAIGTGQRLQGDRGSALVLGRQRLIDVDHGARRQRRPSVGTTPYDTAHVDSLPVTRLVVTSHWTTDMLSKMRAVWQRRPRLCAVDDAAQQSTDSFAGR